VAVHAVTEAGVEIVTPAEAEVLVWGGPAAVGRPDVGGGAEREVGPAAVAGAKTTCAHIPPDVVCTSGKGVYFRAVRRHALGWRSPAAPHARMGPAHSWLPPAGTSLSNRPVTILAAATSPTR